MTEREALIAIGRILDGITEFDLTTQEKLIVEILMTKKIGYWNETTGESTFEVFPNLK